MLTASSYGNNTRFAGTAIIHTPVAGNFTSPNSGDIAYYGRCGTSGAPCWRVHGGSAPRNFGASIAFQGTNVYSSS